MSYKRVLADSFQMTCASTSAVSSRFPQAVVSKGMALVSPVGAAHSPGAADALHVLCSGRVKIKTAE